MEDSKYLSVTKTYGIDKSFFYNYKATKNDIIDLYAEYQNSIYSTATRLVKCKHCGVSMDDLCVNYGAMNCLGHFGQPVHGKWSCCGLETHTRPEPFKRLLGCRVTDHHIFRINQWSRDSEAMVPLIIFLAKEMSKYTKLSSILDIVAEGDIIIDGEKNATNIEFTKKGTVMYINIENISVKIARMELKPADLEFVKGRTN